MVLGEESEYEAAFNSDAPFGRLFHAVTIRRANLEPLFKFTF